MLDKWFPFLVGNRTQILALTMAALKLLAGFGVIQPGIVDTTESVLGPLALATLAAKLSRPDPVVATSVKGSKK